MAQCKAHTSAGKPCKQPAIRGGNVCRSHGGSAPQVKAKARERLLALLAPAVSVYEARMKDKKRPDLSFAAAREVIKVNGVAEPIEVKVEATMTVLDPAALLKLTDDELTRFIAVAAELAAVAGRTSATEAEQDSELLPG